ncbi:hypothetical protein JAO29_08690 [Edaphobacter sp. HDX4]|uniref:hypothetical protein n=1 Tax=Edaphobacter sp. HDX4 TaxID=2794064 RepID=UPI002FE5EFC9
MNSQTLAGASSTRSNPLCRAFRPWCLLLLFLALSPVLGHAQKVQAQTPGAEPKPEPAVAAIFAAFDQYEVVGMPEAHGMKDIDDFLLSLIRNPVFPEKVNDIEVECGNSLYQGVLDRYIAGEDVPFAEVRKVWRNTTQVMCSTSGFFEQFFPLIRSINQKLPAEKRLRVLAGDPPIDWDQVKTVEDYRKFSNRDASIASVMEREVLSKHRKALMMFGTFHLLHGAPDAVSIYEKNYPNVTFVIADSGLFNTGSTASPENPFIGWQPGSLAKIRNTWIADLGINSFFPPPIMIDQDCKVKSEFPKEMQQNMGKIVDAILYLGPQDLRLKEQMPADIALDIDYMTELQRRESLTGFPGAKTRTLEEINRQIVNSASNPLLATPRPPDLKLFARNCLDRKNSNAGH